MLVPSRHTLFLLSALLIPLLSFTTAELPSCYRAHCSHCQVKFIATMCPETCGPCPSTATRADSSPLIEIKAPRVKSPSTGASIARSPQSHSQPFQPELANQPVQVSKAFGQKSIGGFAAGQRVDAISGLSAGSPVHSGGTPVNSGSAQIRGPPVAHGLPPQPIDEAHKLPLFASSHQQQQPRALITQPAPPPPQQFIQQPPQHQQHQQQPQIAGPYISVQPQQQQQPYQPPFHQQFAAPQQPIYQQQQFATQYPPPSQQLQQPQPQQQFYQSQPQGGFQQQPPVIYQQQPPPPPATMRPPTYLNPIPQHLPPQPPPPQQQFYQLPYQPTQSAQNQGELQRPRQIYNQVQPGPPPPLQPPPQPPQPQPALQPQPAAPSFSQFPIPQLPQHPSFQPHQQVPAQQPQSHFQLMGIPPPLQQLLPQPPQPPQHPQPPPQPQSIPQQQQRPLIPHQIPGILIPPMMATLIPAPRPTAPPPAPPPPPAAKSYGEKEGVEPEGAIEGTCPKDNWEPCISKEVANKRFKQCCQRLGEGCSSMCSYDQTLANIQLAVLTGRCPLNKVADMMICASGYEDATPCCEAFGVFAPGYEQCRPYCNPSGGLPTAAEGHLAEKYRCLGKMPIIQRCFFISQKP